MALFSALQKFITKDGQPVEGASVIVKLAGSATPATLYATRDGGTKSNPFLTDAAGNALCYVSPGRYDMTVTFNAEQVTFNDVEVGPVSQVGSFADGVTLTDPDQWVRDSDGALWEYTGSTTNFPLQVAPGSAPDGNFRVVVPNGGRQVSSVDALRVTKARFNGEAVQLVSYYAGANKGGGVFVWDATSTSADDGGVTIAVTGVATGRWVRQLDGFVTPEMFGARGDYSFSTDSGTDDKTAIDKTKTFASSSAEYGTILLTSKYLYSDTLSIPRGVAFKGLFGPVGGENQTGGVVYPPAVEIGTAIVCSKTTGPAVLINRSDSKLTDVVVAATQARSSALISSGAQNINCGVCIEPDDGGSGSSLRRSKVDNVVSLYHPADGFYMAADIVGVKLIDTVALNCGRHGWVVDCGTLSGRTNRKRPGIISVKGHRSVNLGGHGYVIGDAVSSLSLLPYRVKLEGYEGFRCGSNISHLLRSAHGYIRGTAIDADQSAFVCTAGTSGAVPTLSHSVAVSGRNIKLENNRYVDYVEEPVLIFAESGLINNGITIDGATLNTQAALPVNMVKLLATVSNLKVNSVDKTGISGDIIDLSTATASSDGIEITDGGKVITLKQTHTRVVGNAFNTRIFSIPDDGVAVLSFTGTAFIAAAQIIGSISARGTAKVHFRCGTAAFATLVDSSGVTVGVGTTALTGTTGIDGQLNVAATSDLKLYIENRTGATANYSVTLLSAITNDGELL